MVPMLFNGVSKASSTRSTVSYNFISGFSLSYGLPQFEQKFLGVGPVVEERGVMQVRVEVEDVRIAGDNEREVAMKLAGACNEVQKGFAFSKNHASVKKQPEAKELTTKRSMDLGL